MWGKTEPKESAMASIKSVLTKYFKQLHFNEMSPDVLARWKDYLSNNDLVENMKDWRSQLMHETAPDSGEYANNELPDIFTELTDEQIKDLYKIFNTALGGMKEDDRLKSATYDKVSGFVNEFYGKEDDGTNKIFHPVELSKEATQKLNELVNNGTFDSLRPAINSFINDYGLKSEISFDSLVQGITTKKYNSDPDFKKNLIYILENIGSQNWRFKNAVTDNVINEFQEIAKGFDFEPSNVDITRFKDKYAEILKRIYKNNKIKEVLSSHDRGEITGPLDTARDKVDYDKSDRPSYVPPKTEDELNLFQQVKKYVGDTYEDCLSKYTKLRGDRMFFSMPAQLIVKAIDKANIKPTDGIAAVLDNADKIKKGLKEKSNKAPDHFDWFVQEMNKIKQDMPKAFEGGLKNGPQLRAIIQRIIKDAVPAKMNEAKTAMEVLSVIKYGNTTSKIMDTLKSDKELFNIFSNDKLSWNKNDGMKFVTSALDKSVRAAFIGIGYGVTMAINGVRKSRSKIKKENKYLSAAHEEWKKQNDIAKEKKQQEHDRMERRREWANIFLANSRSDKDIEPDLKKAEKELQDTNKSAKPQLDKWQQELSDILQQLLNDPATKNDPDMKLISDYLNQIQNGEIDAEKPQLNGAAAGYQGIIDNIDGQLKVILLKQQAVTRNREQLNDFLDAKEALENADKQITNTKEELDKWDEKHKDQYQELIDFWNRLETGREFHTGEMYSWRPGSAQKKQEEFWKKLGGRGM